MRPKTLRIIELTGGMFSALVLLGGALSPWLLILSILWEVLTKWL